MAVGHVLEAIPPPQILTPVPSSPPIPLLFLLSCLSSNQLPVRPSSPTDLSLLLKQALWDASLCLPLGSRNDGGPRTQHTTTPPHP